MDQLIEVLQQIQDLAGVAIDALSEAAGGAAPERLAQAITGNSRGDLSTGCIERVHDVTLAKRMAACGASWIRL